MRIVVLTLIIAGMVSLAFAQPEKQASPSRRSINEKGWDLKVELSDFEVASASTFEIDTVDVEVTHYRVESKPEVVLENGSQCEIRNLRSYKVDGFVFAIEWGCYGFAVDPTQGKVYLACMVQPTFLDEDLDGKFEVKTYLEKIALPPLIAKKYGPPPPPRRKNDR